MIKCDVNVENITVKEDTLVRNTVANDFVYGCANGFWEIAVVQRRWIGLRKSINIDCEPRGKLTFLSKQAL
jgi:hypothetical protein